MIFPNTIDPAIEIAANRPQVRPEGLPNGKILLSVARLASSERAKGVDTMIRAMPAILRDEPEAALVVVGRGDDRKRLEQIAKEERVQDKIHFAGYVPNEELPAYYAHCDLFALPSSKEGFGIVFLEAMCFGKPCLGALAGGTPEAIGTAGALIEPADIPAAARAALALLHSPPSPDQVRRHIEPYRFYRFRRRLRQIVY